MDSDDSKADGLVGGLGDSSCLSPVEAPSHKVHAAEKLSPGEPHSHWRVKCFSLEVIHLSCAYSPLARTIHGPPNNKGSREGWPSHGPVSTGSLYHRGPCRNDFSRTTWLSRGTDRMDTRSGKLPTPCSSPYIPLCDKELLGK